MEEEFSLASFHLKQKFDAQIGLLTSLKDELPPACIACPTELEADTLDTGSRTLLALLSPSLSL